MTTPTKLRTGDEVIVVAGKDLGKKGTLRKIIKTKNKAIVTGINMVKKHTKPNPEMGVTGGVVEAANDKKHLESAVQNMTAIAGQKPVITKARKSVASFKIREGWPLGCKVTLRGEKMYEFMERLIDIAIPRERDFRGLNPKSFDGQGNYNFGIKEQIIFPEIKFDNVDTIRGMDICINTSATNKEDAKALLEVLEFPFKK
ncbi:50S ribosomal protein L5 [Gammaproteobacteria bacterium]|nr:50S ribosomal protein L5 [Gammaproteobacteria bacterium]